MDDYDIERAERRETRPPALRVRAEGAVETVTDGLAGQVTGVVDDFVVVRNDGVPAYNLAVVVDDVAQGVDQVVRGDDLLSSSPRQAWLTRRLGGSVAQYLHVPLVVNADGRRLAKRTGPGAFQLLHGPVAAVDDVQRRDQFASEHVLARRHEGLGGEHLHRRIGDFRAAEPRLAPPYGNDDLARHAEALLDPAECGRMGLR